MWPLLGPALITGGASLLSGLFSSQQSGANTQAQIQAQEQMQMQNEQWQTQMSNTAYTRATADMKNAGLNPMMMFGSGGAASTPSVGTPNVPVSQKQSPMANLGDAVQHGLSSMIQAKTIDKMGDEIAKLQADVTATNAQTDLTKAVTTGQAQRNIIALPDETKAQMFNDWLRYHPQLTTASEVGSYVGGSLDKAIKAIPDIIGSISGAKGLLANPANPTAKYTGLGPSGTQTVKDMIDDALKDLER